MIKITDSKQFDSISQNEAVFILFSADWCTPCQTYKPIIESIQSHYGDRIEFYVVDIERLGDVVHRLNILSIPTVLLMKSGQVQDRLNGLFPQTPLKERLDKFLGAE